MDSFYAFKCERIRNTRNTVTFGKSIVSLFLKHPVKFLITKYRYEESLLNKMKTVE
jgi:hypothetical protein